MESIDNFFFQPSTQSPSISHDTFDVSCFFASSESNPTGLQSEPSPSIDSSEYSSYQKQLPFTIIRHGDPPPKPRASVVQKKVIEKKNKGGKRKLPNQQELKSLLSQAKKHYIPDGIENPNLTDSAKRKMIQAVKNRIAAQRTRDRRKAQFGELQETQEKLAQANEELNSRYSDLERKFRLLEEANRKLAAENEELRRRNVPNFPPVEDNKIMIESNIFVEDDIESLLRQKNGGLTLSRTSSTKSDWMQLFTSFAIIIAVYTGSHIKVGNVVNVDKGTGKPEGGDSTHHQPEANGPQNPETGTEGEEPVKKSKSRGKGDEGNEATFNTFATGPVDETPDESTFTGAGTDDPADSNPFSATSEHDPDGFNTFDTNPTDESGGSENPDPNDSNERKSLTPPPPLPDTPSSNPGEMEPDVSIPGSQSPENFSWSFDIVCIAIFLFSILTLVGFKYMKKVWNWFGNRSSERIELPSVRMEQSPV